ncbi:MAG: cytochrome P450 [Acidimicrobiales bacterium]|nr:cytochrome P450 [Acidimicrobiales bacterium]
MASDTTTSGPGPQAGGTRGASAQHDDLVHRVLDDGFLAGDPFPDLARLRAEAPVAHHAATGAWVLSRHADVVAASRDPATFCSGKGILLMEIGASYDSPPTMMHTDPPAHTRYRKLVQPAFAPSVMRALEDAITARARAAVAALPAGEPVDVVAELAVPFPLRVISDLLGIPEDDWPRFYEWSEAAIPGATDWPPERTAELMGEMVTYLLATAAARRADPHDDVISLLATVEVDGDTLDDTELAMFLVQLLVAGNETTRNALSGGLVAFAEHPDQWARLRSGRAGAPPAALDTAVDEVLRWTTPVVYFMRTTTREVTVRDVTLPAGTPVVLHYLAANRDEAEFGPTADRFDIGRTPNHHVAFGSGPHFCLGAALARIELRAMLDALAARFAAIEPAGPVERSMSLVIAGVRRAPMVLTEA